MLSTMNPSDVAGLFADLEDERIPLAFRLLPKELAADTFAEMDPQDIIGTEIIKVTVGSDVYTLNQTVTFEPNKQHKCTLKINKIGEGVNISIGGWESADTDFGGTLE